MKQIYFFSRRKYSSFRGMTLQLKCLLKISRKGNSTRLNNSRQKYQIRNFELSKIYARDKTKGINNILNCRSKNASTISITISSISWGMTLLVTNKVLAQYKNNTSLVLIFADQERCEIRATAWSEHIDTVSQMLEVNYSKQLLLN